MRAKTPIPLLSPDAITVQAALLPGEKIRSIRDLVFRSFGRFTPETTARTYAGLRHLADAGRVSIMMEGDKFKQALSHDDASHLWQLQAITYRMVRPR